MIKIKAWEKKALKNDLLDINAWVNHAVKSGVFKSKKEAIKAKVANCVKRMRACLEDKGAGLSDEEVVKKVSSCKSYKCREVRQKEEDEANKKELEELMKASEEAALAKKEELRNEILKMKEEGLI